MKKIILSTAIIAMYSLTANAQTKSKQKSTKFSIGLIGGLPLGRLEKFSTLVYGGDLQAEFSTSYNSGITFSGGYLKFAGKDNHPVDGGLIPIMLGGKYYIDDNLYAHVQMGISVSTNKGDGSAFTYAPGIGYKVTNNFDVAIKYQAATQQGYTTAFLGLRAAYCF
ncbi:MAG: hypothetical protein H7334_01750 [Ferruginibacter sp.]|nr:hypothetical protein [Ferruginibacter sp.]